MYSICQLCLIIAILMPIFVFGETKMINRKRYMEMVAEVIASRDRKIQKKQNKKEARQEDGKRRDVRRENRRDKDLKAYRRDIPNGSKDRLEDQKENRREVYNERRSRKRLVHDD